MLETQAIGRLAIRSGRVLIWRRCRDDIALHHFGAVGEAIECVDHAPRRRAVFAYRIDHIQHLLLDGDLLRALGENVEQPQHADREQDK